MNVYFKSLSPLATPPSRATDGSAGYDLYACYDYTITLGEVTAVRTGIALDMRENITNAEASAAIGGSLGMCAMVLPRSGLGTKHGIILANSVGLVDNDYQGEIIGYVYYEKREGPAQAPVRVIKHGERFAQMVFVPFMVPELIAVTEFASESQRGAGGFGSTGD